MSKVLIVIPARYGSSRLPGKILKPLGGKPVIQHVYEACKNTGLGRVLIATESPVVVEAAAKFGAEAVLTSSACQSGTDRVFEASQNCPEEFIINVQGDEPFIKTETVAAVAGLLQKDASCDIATAVFARPDDERVDNPNIVKAVLAKDGRALYFSRSRVPYKREQTEENKQVPYWHHCGIYGYRRDALKRFVTLPESPLEKLERLEQLRALEAGMTIKCVEIRPSGPAIDTEQDLAAAEVYYKTYCA
ncbi:MAG: 3-deoxy-manno-octulosonate cytidylyltransferase [Elusimicrobiaceae bacterium]|nr:3-deoxy-manno-octulosonate cytidylyltransferase [Elusimicrobiaceae bacterium]